MQRMPRAKTPMMGPGVFVVICNVGSAELEILKLKRIGIASLNTMYNVVIHLIVY